jgi:hypothetical protein
MFAQAVYLMFSSVYVCKETVEHLLLSAGGVEGHHHHHTDEDAGLYVFQLTEGELYVNSRTLQNRVSNISSAPCLSILDHVCGFI